MGFCNFFFIVTYLFLIVEVERLEPPSPLQHCVCGKICPD